MPGMNSVERARKRLGLKQYEFGDLLGISRWTVMRLEWGPEKDIPEQTRLAIVRLLAERKARRRQRKKR